MDEDDRRARLEALYEAYATAVRGYLRRRTDAATADDLLSDAFVVACRRFDLIPSDPLPWLLTCARNLLANSLRGERRRLALIGRLRDTSQLASLPIESGRTRLAEAFATLRDRDREVLLLIAWDDLSSDQAAAVLGCTRHTFAKRLQRARRRLEAALLAADEVDNQTLMEACNE